MGSYCISCGVSGQVIANGDKCLALPIRQHGSYEPVEMTWSKKPFRAYAASESNTYPDSFWKPVGSFVSGTYDDDHGYIVPDDTPVNRRAIARFALDLAYYAPEVAAGENEVHDLPFNIKSFLAENTPVLFKQLQAMALRFEEPALDELVFEELERVWRYVWGVGQENRLFWQYWGNVWPLQFAAFHQEAFSYLVEYASTQKLWNGQSMALDAHLGRQLEMIAETDKKRASKSKVPLADDISRGLEFRDGLVSMAPVPQDGICLLAAFEKDHLALLERYFEEALTFAQFAEAMRPSMSALYALVGMHRLNLRFTPISTAGQDYGNDVGRAVARFVSHVSKTITQQRASL